jgi:hypothetical protein
MAKIAYSLHLKFRLKLRKMPYSLPLDIYQNSKEHYFDTETNKYVCLQEIKLLGKMREIAVTYEKIGDQIVLITIHPLKSFQKSNRIKSGRWIVS